MLRYFTMRALVLLLLVGVVRLALADSLAESDYDQLKPVADRTTSPALQIGLLIARKADLVKYCTAALIRYDTILTAAHCVVGELTFTLGYHETRGSFENIPAELVKQDFRHQAGRDWAILRLSKSIPSEIPPLAIGDQPLEDDTPVSVYGYPFNLPKDDPGQVLHVHEDCTYKYALVYSGEITTDCQLVPNMSGGPLIHWVDGEPLIVGVAASATRESKLTFFASGLAVNKYWQTIKDKAYPPRIEIPPLP